MYDNPALDIMLAELYIENFALIDKLTVTFNAGLNILTGETGAGKSIVIDAINVLLGERVGTELVRTGAERAILQATFDLQHAQHLLPMLDALGIAPEDDLLVLAREVAREGRNTARINGRTCPVSVVRQVGDLLVDLHGQHEHQSLLREEHHRAFLDALGDESFALLRRSVADLAQHRATLLREWQGLQSEERDRLRMIDLLSFQVEEIEQAQLTPGEDDALAAERLRLANAEKLHDAAIAAFSVLYEGEGGGQSVQDALGEALGRLAALTRYDAALEALVTSLDAASVLIADASHELSAYCEQMQFEPERLAELEERLTLLHTLKRKYGETIEAIITYGAEKRVELERLTHHEERRDEIQAAIHRLEKTLAEQALQLLTARKALARLLADGMQAELAHLGMPKAIFEVNFRTLPQADGLPVNGERVAVTTHGIDQISFYISANAGEPTRPLAKVASGGELSRVMLALKTISARGDGVPTLIFDEIDTGIGGRTAEAVGQKLAQVAKSAQVIAVTHLAQLAFYADTHFLIEKTSDDARTSSIMRALSHDERVEELARLQAGARISDAVLSHVRTVLDEIDAQKKASAN